jgi:hypothetical protein
MMTIEMHNHKQDDEYQVAYTKKITTMMKCVPPCKTTKKKHKTQKKVKLETDHQQQQGKNNHQEYELIKQLNKCEF